MLVRDYGSTMVVHGGAPTPGGGAASSSDYAGTMVVHGNGDTVAPSNPMSPAYGAAAALRSPQTPNVLLASGSVVAHVDDGAWPAGGGEIASMPVFKVDPDETGAGCWFLLTSLRCC